MPYRLKLSESVPSGIKRIVREEIDTAVEQLRGKAGGPKDEALSQVADTLQEVEKRVKAWPLETDGFEAIRPGLKTTFRQAKQRLAFARKHRAPEDFHEWRKRLKDHWYHVRLLENLWTDVMEGYEKSLKDVETWLGDDHNLVVLGGALLSDPEFRGRDKEVELCLNLVGK